MNRFSIALVVMIALTTSASLFAQPAIIGAENAVGLWGSDTGGCGNDIVSAAFKAANFDFEMIIVPYARAKAMTLDGRCAACFSMIWEEAFQGKIVFAKNPLYHSKVIFIQKKDRPMNVSSVAAIKPGTSIGTVIDYEYPFSLDELSNRGVKLNQNKSESGNLSMLALGRLDLVAVYVDELKSLDSILKEEKLDKNLFGTAFEASTLPVYVGFSLSSPQGLIAKKKFDHGYDIIKTNGVYEAILESWKNKL